MLERMPQFDTLKEENLERVKTDPIGLFLEQLDADQEFKDVPAEAADLSFMSREQRAETLWALFQEVKGEISGRTAHKRGETTKREVSGFSESVGLLKTLYADEEARTSYVDASQKYLQEIESINGDWEKYEALQKQIQEAEAAVDATAKKIFSSRGGSLSESDAILFEVNRRRLTKTRQELAVIVSENPELAAYAQYDNLRDYAQELNAGGFMWLPSRREALEQMETAALGGKPVLLSGESGTGKTRLVEEVAMTLTGRPVNQTPGKDVRFQDLIAKRDIGADGTVMNTYYRYGEIGEAVTGKATTLDEKPRHAGGIVADDEFNLLPAAEQTERLARIAAWTPGKRIKMPVTNEEVVVGTNFLYTAMVNLASERYARTKIPPEVLRKFAKVDLDYLKQTDTEPELYEAMLAALTDENGRLRAAVSEVAPQFEDREEVETAFKSGQEVKRTVRIRELQNQMVDANGRTQSAGGFLWRFSQAISEINKSFSHRETVLKARGEGQFVKDLIIDIGSLTSWLKEYRTIGNSQNLEAFIIDKLDKEFLSKQAYSAEDRLLVREFFRHFGITATPDGVEQAAKTQHQFANLTPVEIGKLSPRVRYKEIVNEELILTESYLINAEGERVEYKIEAYVEGKKHLTPGQVIKAKDSGEFVLYRGLSKKTGDPIFVPYKAQTEKPPRGRENDLVVSLEKAAEIMGADFLGPDAVEKSLGVRLEQRDVPAIPFSKEDLERAKELGQMLILRVSNAPDGDVLSMVKLNNLVKARLKKEKKGKALFEEAGWQKNEDFYTNEAPQTAWALVSKEIVPDSTSKNYLEQTELLSSYLRDQVFGNMSLPPEYAEALAEYEAAKGDIERIMNSDWREAAKRLSELKLNQLTRQLPIEAFYDILVRLLNNGERSLEKTYTWTGRRISDGLLVVVGLADADGADVGASRPGARYGYLGVSFSRSR
ncbi:MAG: hypothetical protein C3F02_02590 [Parcubacteria group bacterium]|nr:MAG: hypothetical protein C3F02_02590 [Parcubacteria group bacterium]